MTRSYWTDYRRSNPELEATRERWNARFCNAAESQPEPSRMTLWAAVVAVVLVGISLIGSLG